LREGGTSPFLSLSGTVNARVAVPKYYGSDRLNQTSWGGSRKLVKAKTTPITLKPLPAKIAIF